MTINRPTRPTRPLRVAAALPIAAVLAAAMALAPAAAVQAANDANAPGPAGTAAARAADSAKPADANASAADTKPVAPELRRIADGYLRNRSAFGSFRCEFRLRVGQAANLQEALQRGPTLRPLTATCTWIVDGQRICCRREIDQQAKDALERSKANPMPQVIAGQPAFIAEIPLSGMGYLTDGRRALRYDPDFVANLMGPERIEELIENLCPDETPWALGGMGRTLKSNPGRWILDGKLGQWRLAGRENADGNALEVVECRRDSYRSRYAFDPRRGWLPVRRQTDQSSGGKVHLAVTDVRECSGGRFFPARVAVVDLRPDGTLWRVHEIVLTALDADTRVKADEMFLTLRRGIEVNHVDNLLTAFKLPAGERVGIDDLASLHTRCQANLERRLRQRAGEK